MLLPWRHEQSVICTLFVIFRLLQAVLIQHYTKSQFLSDERHEKKTVQIKLNWIRNRTNSNTLYFLSTINIKHTSHSKQP